MINRRRIIDINAHITNIDASVVLEDSVPYAQISFTNLGYGFVSAVKFNTKGFNSFGDAVLVDGKTEFPIIIQDLRIAKHTPAKGIRAKLPDTDIRRLEMEEYQVCFADGTVLTYPGADIREYDVEVFNMCGLDSETLKALHDMVSPEIVHLPIECEDGWLCSCENFNPKSCTACSKCGVKKEDIFRICNSDYVASIITKYQQELERKRELAQKEAENNAKAVRKKKLLIWIAAVITLMIICLIGHRIVLSTRTIFSSEEEMKSELQGTYTYYFFDDAERQLIIDGNKVTHRVYLLDDPAWENEVTKWDYKSGKVCVDNIVLIVQKNGYLKYSDNIYKEGGYMSTSKKSYSTTTYSNESGYAVLDITIDSVTYNSSYNICTGNVKNTGKQTYKFVTVKGSFKDPNGNVVDTDWTYAVGAEGLSPGESSSFRLSVPRNYQINSCAVSVMEFK